MPIKSYWNHVIDNVNIKANCRLKLGLMMRPILTELILLCNIFGLIKIFELEKIVPVTKTTD
jgi:hypothetical protein